MCSENSSGRSNAFSPLFIGEGSSTHNGHDPDPVQRQAFSPLFIGEGSSTHIIPFRMFDSSRTFSPLFIGEGSSTHQAAVARVRGLSAFSPLFIGEGSSTKTCLVCEKRAAKIGLFLPIRRYRCNSFETCIPHTGFRPLLVEARCPPGFMS